ncbi:C-type lectin mosGCTL-1-like [Leptinotarsa decemlineata]|uniref:C-type lectin mosGCTL-1-like n=1 Tax=Leptinotarsa decemlineata TaxID=7539 RepID=UPI003D30AB71
MLAKISFLVCCAFLANGAWVTKGGSANYQDPPSLPLYYFGRSSYYFQSFSTATQEQGVLFCKNLNMGLVSIESKQENDFLFETVGSLVDYEISTFWTSGLKNGATWYWVTTGKAFTYTNWAGDTPSNDTGNSLAVIQDSTKMTMEWSETNSSEAYFVICEGEGAGNSTFSAN